LWERTSGVSVENLVAKTQDIANKSNGPGDKRNRAVHDPWYMYTQTEQAAQFKAMPQKDYRYGIYPVDLENLEMTLAEIARFSNRVTALRTAISDTIKRPRS
jgi:hypothetical protein